jgi:hypothetical protein
MICLFNGDDMPRTLTVRLPTAATVTDHWTGESLARRQGELSFEMERVRRGSASLKGRRMMVTPYCLGVAIRPAGAFVITYRRDWLDQSRETRAEFTTNPPAGRRRCQQGRGNCSLRPHWACLTLAIQ